VSTKRGPTISPYTSPPVGRPRTPRRFSPAFGSISALTDREAAESGDRSRMATDMSPSIAQPRRPRRSSAPITAAILSTRTFWGCSNGGRQALMEAQRDPPDFDGLISGAPAYDFTNIAGGFIKNIKAVFTARDSARTPVVTRDNLALIER